MKNSRTLKSIIAILLLVATLFTFGGCDIIMEYLGIKNQLTISATYVGDPIEVGGTLNKKDIVVEATFVEGIAGTEIVYQVENFTVGQLDTTTAGNKTVQVSYTEMGLTATCEVTISVVKKAEPTGITATYNGGDLAIGSTISQSDFSVVVIYDDDTTKTADNFTLSQIDTTTAGDKLVILTYSYLDGTTTKTLQTTVKVTVVATFVHISASFVGEPLQVGDTLTKEQLLVQEVYNDGTEVSVDNFTFAPVDTTTAGTKQVVVSYDKDGTTYNATVDVTVVEVPVTLTSISATFTNNNFYVGQTLSNADFVVVASFSDKHDSIVTDFTIIGSTTFATSGSHTVQLSYTHEGVTQTCNIIVEVLPEPVTFSGIVAAFVGEPIQTGTTLTREHFLVQELYSDDTKVEVTNFTIGSVDVSTAGTKQVTISYQKDGNTYTAQVDIIVVATPVVLQSISATFANSKFFVGDTLTTNDFVVVASFSDKHDSIVTNFTITGEKTFATSGMHTTTLSYSHEGITATCDVTVEVLPIPVTLVSISATFNNTSFYVGDTLTMADFTVTANFSNETSQQVADFAITGSTTFATSGSQITHISYTYEGVTKTCNVVVEVLPLPVTLTGISATFTNNNFYVGKTLTNADFVVVASFSDKHDTIITDFTITGPTTFATSGSHTVQLSYTHEGVTKTCNVTVNVLPLPVTLDSITATANKNEFNVGDTLQLTDFVVTAHFSDGDSHAVSDFAIVTPTGALETAGNVEVELSYTFNGQTRYATLSITVLAVEEEVVNYGKYGVLSKDGKSVKVVDTAKVVDTTDLQIHFLELGNQKTGDCVYIKAGEMDILIDAGSNYDSTQAICNYIDQYVTDGTLEYVIATHAHLDHLAGFVSYSSNGNRGILKRYVCENIIDYARKNTTSNVSKNYEAERDAEVASGANHYTVLECWNNNNESTRFSQSVDATGARRYIKLASNIELEILYQKYYESKASSENDYSVCFMINQYGENYDYNNRNNPENEKNVNHFLFTGDLEEVGEKSLVQSNNLPEVVLYKAGHHGSKTSSCPELMSVIKPKVVCICCCTGSAEYTSANENQFPTQATVNNIAPYTDLVFATSLYSSSISSGSAPLNGNITLTCNHLGINITASNNVTLLKNTDWFKNNRTCPNEWK